MEEKESPKFALESAAKFLASNASNRALAILKLVLGICLLAFVYSASRAFLAEFGLIDLEAQWFFWKGVITFILVYFFVFEPGIAYKRGQKLLELVFKFFAPLVKLAPYALPIYAILVFFVYFLFLLFIKEAWLLNTLLFFLGIGMSLHLVFSAKTLRSRQGDFLKSNYIFGFSLVYILNLLLLSSFLSVLFDKFSFVNFVSSAYSAGAGIFQAIFSQLFVAKG